MKSEYAEGNSCQNQLFSLIGRTKIASLNMVQH